MFLGTDACPQSTGLDLMQCAADNNDHKVRKINNLPSNIYFQECCRERDVHKTSAGEKCLGFCDMRPGVTFQVFIFQNKLECFDRN